MTTRLRIALSVLACLVSTTPGCGGPDLAFDVEQVADGVELFRPQDGGPGSTVVARADGLLVIDAQSDPTRGRALLDAIRARHDAPVRYVVLSHPHRESGGGVGAFGDALVIASARAVTALEDPAFDFDAELGPRDDDAPRPSVTLVVGGEVELADPLVPVRIVPVPDGHAPGELIVALHGGAVIHAGGIPFADGNPYGGTADLTRWISTLNRLSREAPRTVIGTRGPAIDLATLRRRRDALAWLRGQVQEAYLRGTSYDAMAAEIAAVPKAADHFDLEAEPSFLEGLAERAVEEFRAQRRKRGLD